MTESVYGRGLPGLLKRYWHEIPGVMGASVLGVAGLGVCLYAYHKVKNGPVAPKYKMEYTVVRPDDPRATQAERQYPLEDYYKK